jgi:hypothetical protein
MIERRRHSKRKTSLESKSVALSPGGFALFGEPQLLDGEDADAYHELLARVRAAVKPADIIDDMFVADVAALEWEVLRWRRLKTTLIRGRGLTALEEFLGEKLDCDLYADRFADSLTEILEENASDDFAREILEENAPDFARLALACAENEPDAVVKVNAILHGSGQDLESILKNAQTDAAKELVQKYVRHESEAARLVDNFLTQANTTIDALLINALVDKLDDIERIDRLAAVAEGRRNASLREIDRHRAALGGTLRQAVHKIEDGEFELIEPTPAKGGKAA